MSPGQALQAANDLGHKRLEREAYTRIARGCILMRIKGNYLCEVAKIPASGGWGWAVFDYDAASDTFTPGALAGKPPQGNDAKCGFACHTMVKTRDYVFTDYGHR
jgi:hypothetical protein